MEQMNWMDALIHTRCIYNLLGEVLDLSQQLADALDREDQITIRLLLGMREEPIQNLAKRREILMQIVEDLPPEEGERLRELLNDASAETEADDALVQQVSANARLLQRVQELDRQLNRKIAQDKSIYL